MNSIREERGRTIIKTIYGLRLLAASLDEQGRVCEDAARSIERLSEALRASRLAERRALIELKRATGSKKLARIK